MKILFFFLLMSAAQYALANLTAYEETGKFCASETGVRKQSNLQSSYSESCYFGQEFIGKYPNASFEVLNEVCRTKSADRMCLQAIFAHKRFQIGASGAYQRTASFCQFETGAVRGSGAWSLASLACYFGADLAEYNSKFGKPGSIDLCHSDRECMQSIWSYQRFTKGTSLAYQNAELFCATKTGVLRGSGNWSLASNECYLGIDFIEASPQATPEEIQKVCGSDENSYCYKSIESYKAEMQK